MKKYLVLGGNGFIGKYVVDSLAKNNKVIVADYNIEHNEENENIEYKQMDFINCYDFTEYLEGIDIVIHLISTIGPNENTKNINKEIEENVFPTTRLLEAMVKCETKKIIFVSSGGTVYGEHECSPILESDSKDPICNYGIIKELIEKYLNLYSLYYGIDYKVLRLANPYSEVVKKGKKQGIIPILIEQLMNNETIKIWGDGNDVRDYIHIQDAIAAILKVIDYDGDEKIFNVGTGVGCSINDLIELIKEEMQISTISVSYVEGRKCDVKNNILNKKKKKKEMNWEPEITLKKGIQKVIDMKKGFKNR